MHGPKDVTPSEELVAIAAASAAAAAAHTTQMSQGHQGQAGQLAQQPSVTALQQDGNVRPAQTEVDAVSKLSRLQPMQVCPSYATQHNFCCSDPERQKAGMHVPRKSLTWLRCITLLQEVLARQREASSLRQPGQLDSSAAPLPVRVLAASEVPAAQSQQTQSPENPVSEGEHRHTLAQRGSPISLQQSGQLQAQSVALELQAAPADQHDSASTPEKGYDNASQGSAQPVKSQQVGHLALDALYYDGPTAVFFCSLAHRRHHYARAYIHNPCDPSPAGCRLYLRQPSSLAI